MSTEIYYGPEDVETTPVYAALAEEVGGDPLVTSRLMRTFITMDSMMFTLYQIGINTYEPQ